MLRIGLTGGIATGKSHVAARLLGHGFSVLDLDRVGHAVINPGGAAHEDVVAAFGRRVLGPDGSVDRKALAAIVFADPAARATLDALVHPRIRAEERRIAAEAGSDALLVVEAALLVEAGQHLRFDRLVVTYCSEEQQLQRVVARDRLGRSAAQARLRAQMAAAEKCRFGHFVLDTSGPVEQTNLATDQLEAELRALAARDPKRAPLDAVVARRLIASGPVTGPDGLTPSMLHEVLSADGDLSRLAGRLTPRREGPWYGATPTPSGIGPESLAVGVALHGLLSRGDDHEYTAGAAYSIARLTHTDPRDLGRAVLFALALHEAALGAEAPPSERACRLAERWSGRMPSVEDCGAAAARALAEALPAGPETLALLRGLEPLLRGRAAQP